MKLFFYDCETTGTNFWQHGIHQISGAIEIDGEVKEQFNFKVEPNIKAKIEPDALAVAGVTLEQIQKYPPMAQVYGEFIAMLSKYVDRYDKKDKFFLVGYNNASFDNQFLRAWFVQNFDDYFGSWFWSSSLDVMVLATQKLISERKDMIDFKLKTVAKQLGIEIDETKLHDAKYDIEITRKIYQLTTK